jgi:hypothetical protein
MAETKRRTTSADLTPIAEFRNVDLHIRSRRSLLPLLEAWPSAQAPTRVGTAAPRWLVLNGPGGKTATETVEKLLRLVHVLPRRARRCWNEAATRTFDIGVQAGLGPQSFEEVQLDRNTLAAISRVGGQLLSTIYAPSTETINSPEELARLVAKVKRARG